MILRLLLFASILMLFCINNICGALNVAKLNLNPQQQQQQNGDSKQHRHSMDQLEPDLAQTIFGGIQRNPLERTTTAKPKAIAIIKSPTLRGKRDTLPEIKLADVKHLGNDDPLPEQSPKKEADYENTDSRENSKSEAVEATTTVDLIFDERINLSGDSENKNETIIDSELAMVTSGPLELSATTTTSTLSATVSKSQGMVVQEVAAPTPKYNLTQNDNSPTENLDRKILAFEINSHNRKVFEELQKKKSAAIAAKILENPEFNFGEETKAETPVFSTTTITPAPAANEVQIDESKKLLNEVSFNGSPKTLTTSLPSIIQEATKEVENASGNPATSDSKAQESIQIPEQLTQPPNEQPENANEQIPTLTASVEAEAGVIESEVNVKNVESPTEGDVQFSKAVSQESSPEVPDRLKHQTEVPAATPITEAAGSHSKEDFTTPQTSFPEGDFILPENSEALHQAELLAEANAAKVGSLQFPSQLPSIFYEKASQKKKVPKILQQQQQQPPPPPHQETQPPPPPPPTDAQIQGFLLPHRPILDSSVQKRRHLISNYIDPIQQQKSAQFQQKQEFFRKSAVIARERSRRETKPEQTTVTYEDDVIDEVDSGESNIIVRLTTNAEEENPTTTTADKNVEDITATTAGVESSTSLTREHQIKLVSKKNGSKKNVLDNEVQKSTVILENEEHATTAAVKSAESKTSESTDSASTIESTKPSEATTTTDEPTIPLEATTAKPNKKPKISKALTREEKLALLESQSPRTGINLGKIHLPNKSSTEAIDASAEPQDPENPWTHRFKSHIQLKLTDESREVVERTELKVLPKLISPEVLKAQKKAEREAKKKAKKEAEEEELEFKDLPEPRSGDLKVDVDVVTKPATKSATLLTTTVTPTTSRSRAPQQLQQQIPQNFFVRPQQQFQQQPQQQFFQQQQQQFFQSQQQQIFPQQRTQFAQQRIISIDGVRYILRDPAPQQQFIQPPPQQFFQPQPFQLQQQQFFQRPPPPPLRAPPSHSPPPTQQPSINSTPKIKPHRIIHSGNAKQFSTTPAPTIPTLGPRVNPEDLSVVRIFQHRGTTKQIFATTPAPTTRPPSATAFVTESTTQWIPVTFTTHPTPTTPFDIFLVTTAAPIPNSRVKTHRDLFEVYDEVEFSDPITTTSKPKKIKKPLPRRNTPPSTKKHDPSDFDLISEVAEEQSFRDIPLRHPPHDPPSTNFEDYFDDQQRKSLRRKQPKLVRLNNSNAAVSQKAADFIGDVPIAKSDLRGLDKTIALNS